MNIELEVHLSSEMATDITMALLKSNASQSIRMVAYFVGCILAFEYMPLNANPIASLCCALVAGKITWFLCYLLMCVAFMLYATIYVLIKIPPKKRGRRNDL